VVCEKGRERPVPALVTAGLVDVALVVVVGPARDRRGTGLTDRAAVFETAREQEVHLAVVQRHERVRRVEPREVVLVWLLRVGVDEIAVDPTLREVGIERREVWLHTRRTERVT
jgi:hypothetical protein